MQNTIFSRRRVVTFVCAASVLAACGTTFAAGTVNLNGSTTVLPVMQQVSEAFMQKNPGVVVTISGTGSGNGIKALRDKMTDVAMSSRDLKDKEKKDFEAHGINPVKIPVALDAIIPVVSPKNAVASLTMEQLRDLFAGKIKNWKELGGADAPVVVVGRDSSSGTFESWQELVMGKTRVSQRALLQSSSGGVVQPGAKTAQDGTWPISRELYLFTSGQPQGDAKKLVDYTLSAEGQQFVSKSGFVPLK